jgi:hypothetical protein
VAAVTLRQVCETHPDAALDIVPGLADRPDNQTSIDTRTVPFTVREETVGAVTVEIISDAISKDPRRGAGLLTPLVGLVPTADVATQREIFETLAVLSQEFPERSTVAVNAAADGLQAGRSNPKHIGWVGTCIDTLCDRRHGTNPAVRADC